MTVTKLSRKFVQSTCNSHSNHLRRWIGLIRIQCESVQCAFRVDAINSHQCAFNAHYFCRVDRPLYVLRVSQDYVYSQIKTRYIQIKYRTIFKILIPSAKNIQKFHFLMQIQDMDQNSFFLGMVEHEAIQTQADSHHQKSLSCIRPS